MTNVHHRGDQQPESLAHRVAPGFVAGRGKALPVRTYSLVVTTVPDGAGQPRPLLALRRHLPLLEYLGQRAGSFDASGERKFDAEAQRLAAAAGLAYERVRPLLPLGEAAGARHHHPLVRPLVLRASCGERLLLQVANLLPATAFSLALVDDDFGIQPVVEARPAVPPGQRNEWTLACTHAGIFPIYNRACPHDLQRRCLLGVLIVEP